MKKIVLATLVLLAFGSFAARAETTADNTAVFKAAERYQTVVNTDQLMDDIFEQLQKNPQTSINPEELKEIRTSIDMVALKKVVTDSLVKHFTVKELDAMTTFYGSPEGQSILHKMPLYMADVMPYVQTAVISAVRSYLSKHAAGPAPSAPQ